MAPKIQIWTPSPLLDLEELKVLYSIGSEYSLIKAEKDAVCWVQTPGLLEDSQRKQIPVSIAHFQCGFSIPPHPFVCEVLNFLECPPYALFPSCFIFLTAYIHYTSEKGNPSVEEFLALHRVVPRKAHDRIPVEKMISFQSRTLGCSLVDVEVYFRDWPSSFVWVYPLTTRWEFPTMLGPHSPRYIPMSSKAEAQAAFNRVVGDKKHVVSREALLDRNNLIKIGVQSQLSQIPSQISNISIEPSIVDTDEMVAIVPMIESFPDKERILGAVQVEVVGEVDDEAIIIPDCNIRLEDVSEEVILSVDEDVMVEDVEPLQLPSSTDNEEVRLVRLEDIFPEMLAPLPHVLESLEVGTIPPQFGRLLTQVEIAKLRRQGDFPEEHSFPTVHDLMSMDRDAWTDYLAYLGLLAATMNPPRTRIPVADRYISVSNGLRNVIGEASAMMVDSSTQSHVEEQLKAEIRKQQETINKQSEQIRDMESVFRALEVHINDSDRAVEESWRLVQAVTSAFDANDRAHMVGRIDVEVSRMMKLNETKILVLKEFVRSKLALDCFNLLFKNSPQERIQRFKSQAYVEFGIRPDHPSWSKMEKYEVFLQDSLIHTINCEEFCSELMTFAEWSTSFPGQSVFHSGTYDSEAGQSSRP